MLNYVLGTIEASEALIKDLYIDLRTKVNAWSEITQQTPQARMGYIGQHLVSVVTGYPGGKSGARGDDLIMGQNRFGEIKCCYRVDQLGKCKSCNSSVSGFETTCASCGSDEIERKEDSKWLIPVKDDAALRKVLSPKSYYFVLFEYTDMTNIVDSDITVSIWEVDPKTKGFAYCMIDYHVNSNKNAPFNMWPHMIKFALTNPKLIYRSRISAVGEINTEIFPTLENEYYDELKPLSIYSSSLTITAEYAKNLIKRIDSSVRVTGLNKKRLLEKLEDLRQHYGINNIDLCDMLAEEIYLPKIQPKKAKIPAEIKALYTDLSD